ncbi:hypothetical protein Tco_1035429 [Tanacetum coccineum]
MPRLWWRSWCRCGGGVEMTKVMFGGGGVEMFGGGGVEMTKVVSVVSWSRRCCWRQGDGGGDVAVVGVMVVVCDGGDEDSGEMKVMVW